MSTVKKLMIEWNAAYKNLMPHFVHLGGPSRREVEQTPLALRLLLALVVAFRLC